MTKENQLTKLPYGLPGRIYRSPMPFSPYFDPEGKVLDAYIEAGVNTVVMLTPIAEMIEITGSNLYDRYQQLGFQVIHAPVEDFSVPQDGAFQKPIQEALRAAKAGRTIVIHCHAGLGRSGMFAACLAKVVFDMDAEAASQWVRQYIPNAVETWEQHHFIKNFEYKAD